MTASRDFTDGALSDRRATGRLAAGVGTVLLHALPIAALVLALYWYWFVVADRYMVFLYDHDMGPAVPDTSPFSPVTASRYWMAGLVAGGVAATLYTGACWLAGRLSPRYRPPHWWPVALTAGVPVLVGVPAITMTLNSPTLPAPYAAQTTLAALVGLGLAVAPAPLAARRPWRLGLLTVYGFGVAGVILTVAMVEQALGPARPGAVLVLAVALLVSLGTLAMSMGTVARRRLEVPSATDAFVAGLCVAYLGLPFLHYVAFTDGYFYVTDAANFFASNRILQGVAWLAGAAAALGVTVAGRWLTDRLRCGRM